MANGVEGKKGQPFVADAMDPLAADAALLQKMIFAEDAAGGPEAWAAVGSTALNRLRTGKFGKTLKAVIKGMSAAISTNSPQWQKADKGDFNFVERRVYDKIGQIADGLVGGQIKDTVNGATHFENLRRYPMPYWAKDMDAVSRVGRHTYFKAKEISDGNGP